MDYVMSQSIYEGKKKKKKKFFPLDENSSAVKSENHYWLNQTICTDIGALITRDENQLISLVDG